MAKIPVASTGWPQQDLLTDVLLDSLQERSFSDQQTKSLLSGNQVPFSWGPLRLSGPEVWVWAVRPVFSRDPDTDGGFGGLCPLLTVGLKTCRQRPCICVYITAFRAHTEYIFSISVIPVLVTKKTWMTVTFARWGRVFIYFWNHWTSLSCDMNCQVCNCQLCTHGVQWVQGSQWWPQEGKRLHGSTWTSAPGSTSKPKPDRPVQRQTGKQQRI